jgi:protocatechuate 3,4-dioxygenase beta subunit
MTQLSRRRFAGLSLGLPLWLVPAARRVVDSLQGLGQFVAAGPPPCTPDAKPTPPAPDGPDYRAGSPERGSLLDAGVSGIHLTLDGTVSGVTCGLIKHARLDFWQADARGAYDGQGFRLRGHQFADESGRYRLDTVMPGAAPGHAPCLHVKVQPPGKPAFTTRLFFAGTAGNAADPAFRPELALKVTEVGDRRSATFNFLLDI